jgi:uroporphyrinogen decarboxylase
MHSDGDLSVLMDDLIAMGLDVIQPIDPSCMDMAAVKKKWGDRICLIGNVSNELLRSASTSEIEARVKELLCDAGPGGGFALGSGNSVPNWAKYENYMAMRETCLRHGGYPISIK